MKVSSVILVMSLSTICFGYLPADLNFDRGVDFYDFAIFANEWLFTENPGEPNSISGGAADYVVAASDSPARVKRKADYVCDGVDDQIEIQTAIDSLGDSGGKVVLLKGNYHVNRQNEYYAIGLGDNVEFEMVSGATIILNDAQNCTVISNRDILPGQSGNTGIFIHGGTIDGNKANQIEYVPPNVGSWPLPDKTGHAIQLRHARNCKISGVHIVNTMEHSIMIWWDSHRNIVENCLIENPGKSGQTYNHAGGICVFWYVSNNLIKNNIVLNSEGRNTLPEACQGLYLSGYASFNIFEGNVVSNFHLGLSFAAEGSSYNQIIGNTFNNDRGIIVVGKSAGRGEYVLISANVINAFKGNGSNLQYFDHVIYSNNLVDCKLAEGYPRVHISDCNDVILSNNIIESGWTISVDFYNCSDILITGCQTSKKIRFDNNCSSAIVVNNRTGGIENPPSGICEKNQGYVTENFGVSMGTGSQQVIAHGLDGIPTCVILSNVDDGANPYQSAAADATNIYITATNGKKYQWLAMVR